MRRRSYPRRDEPLPDALPPETRPVGQLVAEALRLYGRRFWPALATGLGLAAVDQIFKDQSVLVWLAGAPLLLAASYVGASALAAPTPPDARAAATAYVAGVLALIPFPFLFYLYVLPGLAWLALVSLAVPVAVIERRGLVASFARGLRLVRADVAHAVGALLALIVVYFVTRTALVVLLRGTGDQTERIAVFLADLVLSPVVFLGAALLYYDQAARDDARAARAAAPV